MVSNVSASNHDVNSQLHLHDCKDCTQLRAEIDARGTHFSPAQMTAIADTWKHLGNPVQHDQQGATFRLSHGETFRVTHHDIEVPPTRTHEWFYGVMKHAADVWGGGFKIDAYPSPDTEYRLKLRAYAKVYGVKFVDLNDQKHPLTQEDIDRLPSMIAQIRKLDPASSRPSVPAESKASPGVVFDAQSAKATPDGDTKKNSDDGSQGRERSRGEWVPPQETYFEKTEREKAEAEREERRKRQQENQVGIANEFVPGREKTGLESTPERTRMRIEDRIAQNREQQQAGPQRERVDWKRYFADDAYRSQIQATVEKTPDRPRGRGREPRGLER